MLGILRKIDMRNQLVFDMKGYAMKRKTNRQTAKLIGETVSW